jgi:hypothetical protein
MATLGREPQVNRGKIKAPEGGDRSFLWREQQASPRYICRRSAASSLLSHPYPGAHAPGYESIAAPRLAIA